MGGLLRRAIRAAGRPPVWLGMALFFDAAFAVAAISVGRSPNLAELLGIAPLLACARCNGRMTAQGEGQSHGIGKVVCDAGLIAVGS